MVASASQLQQNLQSLLPKNIEETRVVPVMEYRGAEGQEWIYDPDWGTYRDVWVPIKSFTGEYFSPSLNRNLTPEESRFVRPIKGQVADLSGEGGGYKTEDVGSFFVGEKLSKFLNDVGAPPEYIYGQQLPGGGFTFNPMNALPTDVGGRTNFAVNYGTSGGPSVETYQSGTLFGSESVDKVIDRLAKAANAALLTYTGGLALGPAGASLLPAQAAGAVSGAAQAALKGGDTADLLTSALSGALMSPGTRELAATAASDLAAIEASMGTPEILGSSNILDAINQAATYAPDVLSNISPEVAAANLGVLEASLGAPSLPVTQLPTGVSISDLAAIEASMGPSVQLPRVPNFQLAPKLEDIFAGFGDYNEAAQNLLGQAQGNLPTITGPTLPTLVNEPVRVPGDTRLVDTIAKPPLTVEDISGQLSPEAKRLMGMIDIAQPGPLLDLPAVGSEQLMPRDVLPDMPKLPDVRPPPDLVGYNEAVGQALADAQKGFLESGKTLQDFLTPDTFVGPTMGDPTKAALYSNEGYGPLSDQTVTGAPITSSPITSLGPAANLNDVIDYLKGGAFVGSLGVALKEAFKAATGSGLGGLGPIIGGLLSRSPTAAPSATVTPGRPVDITSPIQSLLAPKLVQQRPVTLL